MLAAACVCESRALLLVGQSSKEDAVVRWVGGGGVFRLGLQLTEGLVLSSGGPRDVGELWVFAELMLSWCAGL